MHNMKVWKNVKIKDTNKDVLLLSKSFTNYLYGYGPILEICRKIGVFIVDTIPEKVF